MRDLADFRLPPIPESLDGLVELALDLRWSWSYPADSLWRPLDPETWDMTRNPWLLLQSLSPAQLEGLSKDQAFVSDLRTQVKALRESHQAKRWFETAHTNSPLKTIAYFSMEFGLSEALPIYSGGLGLLAGDHLKTASDLGVPLVGIGLLYQQGYFRQMIDKNGRQMELYPFNDPAELPVTLLRKPDGAALRIKLNFPGRAVRLRVWQAQVGRIKLYLLDSNDPVNTAADRGITGQLYGGGPETRLQQEIVLGVGGAQLLPLLKLDPEVYHLNEGHAAFAIIERARRFMAEQRVTFEEALTTTRPGNLFTTHTPVSAGFDRFEPALIAQYLGDYIDPLKITLRDLMALGREHAGDDSEPFNMAYLAVRGSGAVNGVSRLHGEVSRRLFSPLFPRWPVAEVPVGYVTNGVHVPSWDSASADKLWESACGDARWYGTLDTIEHDFRTVPDDELWKLRSSSRADMIHFARERLALQLAASAAKPEQIAQAYKIFSPDTLTLGFARRFASYKRPNLLLRDPDRLTRILTNPERPVQLVIAGKAHPMDNEGKSFIEAWIRYVRRPEVREHAVFLSDYDMLLAERLVQGVDVWINNPRRPWEASGTSGMKLLVNGGLNLSELDGWWAEAYSADVGWALGDGREHGDDPAWDALEAEELYELLEREVVPKFYARNQAGLPEDWMKMMRESMCRLTPQFSTNRMVREYVEHFYVPAASHYARRLGNGAGKEIEKWRESLAQNWNSVRFGKLQVSSIDGYHEFRIEANLGDLPPGSVAVELYADPHNGSRSVVARMTLADGNLYSARVPSDRPASDYTPRIVPTHEDALVPLEADEILWQH